MRIRKTKKFAKWAKKESVADAALIEAAKEISQDMYEANYGDGVLKKRVANTDRGKRGSTRTIVAFKKGNNCYFVFGFEKSAKSTISPKEEKALKLVAKSLFAFKDSDIDGKVKEGVLIEVDYE